jgi:hypothetical protein
MAAHGKLNRPHVYLGCCESSGNQKRFLGDSVCGSGAEQSELFKRIAATESVSLCVPMKS